MVAVILHEAEGGGGVLRDRESFLRSLTDRFHLSQTSFISFFPSIDLKGLKDDKSVEGLTYCFDKWSGASCEPRARQGRISYSALQCSTAQYCGEHGVDGSMIHAQQCPTAVVIVIVMPQPEVGR